MNFLTVNKFPLLISQLYIVLAKDFFQYSEFPENGCYENKLFSKRRLPQNILLIRECTTTNYDYSVAWLFVFFPSTQ